jgi:hypothetical protein
MKYIENAFFDECTGWDECGDFGRQFYKARLTQALGDFPVGTVVPVFVFQSEGAFIQIMSDEGELLFESKVRLVLDGGE